MSRLSREKVAGPVLTVADLCNFVRSHFGEEAEHVAQRHVDAYRSRGLHEIAATWTEVRGQLAKERKVTRAA